MQQRGLRWLNVGRWWICGTGLFVIAPLGAGNDAELPQVARGDWLLMHRLPDFWRTAFYLGARRDSRWKCCLVVAIFFVLKPRPGMFWSSRTDP